MKLCKPMSQFSYIIFNLQSDIAGEFCYLHFYKREGKKKDSGKLCNLPKDAQIIESKAGIQIQISLAPKISLPNGASLVLGQLETKENRIIRLIVVVEFTLSSHR